LPIPQVVHRDIKLENILLDSNRAMKLIDFGLAAFYAPGKKLRVHCGSPSYAAPEIVARKQYEGPPVDVWSLGVVLFAMLAGFLPFHSPTGNKQVRAVCLNLDS
jgi:5'-AMP-activated protein kinase catalytic alpha subunit